VIQYSTVQSLNLKFTFLLKTSQLPRKHCGGNKYGEQANNDLVPCSSANIPISYPFIVRHGSERRPLTSDRVNNGMADTELCLFKMQMLIGWLVVVCC
jgi:hypothetical protein